MKIEEIRDPRFGMCITRISEAFHTHFPNVEWTSSNPDLKIIHVIGGEEAEQLMRMPELSNVVIFQHCVATTSVPSSIWFDLWGRSKLVISFHPLDILYPQAKFNFLRTALGAEPSLFIPRNVVKDIKVASTGYVPETECLDLVFDACRVTNNVFHHTEKNFGWDSNYYRFHSHMKDQDFAEFLSRCQYITGLRLIEGFEMMCIEGAMTGAIPIVPRLPTYDFYDSFGEYIDPNKNIVAQLVAIFQKEYKPLSKEQLDFVRDTFSWSSICKTLYEKIVQ